MRVAEITTRIVRVIEVPRSQLADFLKMPEAQQVGVYFLMGKMFPHFHRTHGLRFDKKKSLLFFKIYNYFLH
jgi:hypothetical protein